MKKVLVLFSGTGSVEKCLNDFDCESRGVDIDKKQNPYYLVNILDWKYKDELTNWVPDIIWSSFVCCEFSNLKNNNKNERDLTLGYSLLNKSFEIYDFIKTINPNVEIILENPKSKYTTEHKRLSKLYIHLVSYCKYGFDYQKNTHIWSSIKLCLMKCDKNTKCSFKKDNNYHRVRLGYCDKNKYPLQIGDSEYFSSLRKLGLIPKGFSNTYMRYRIPQMLLYDIFRQIFS